MISMASGKALGFSLWNLQDRGVLYIGPAVGVYEGQVIGNTSKGEEMTVNPTRANSSPTCARAVPTRPSISFRRSRSLSSAGLKMMAEDEVPRDHPDGVSACANNLYGDRTLPVYAGRSSLRVNAILTISA